MLCIQSLACGYPSLLEPFCGAISGNGSVSIACGGLCSPAQATARSPRPQPLSALYYVVLSAIHDCAESGYAKSGSARVLVRVAWGTNADALKPLTISHTPMNTSHRPPGSE